MAEHHLKTWPEFFDAIEDGRKTFEIRKNDRGFEVGDVLVLHRFAAGFGVDGGVYTGDSLRMVVTYMTEWAQTPGTVVMAISPVERIHGELEEAHERWSAELAEQCRCCTECWSVPCEGCCAGGVCDEICVCVDAWEGGDDVDEETDCG